ncbi:MAG: DUF5719 family protein [Actinomycetales bacterium]
MSTPLGRAIPLALAIGVLAAAAAAAVPGPGVEPAAEPVRASLAAQGTTIACPPPPAVAETATEAQVDEGFVAQPVPSTVITAARTYSAEGPVGQLRAATLPVEAEGAALEAAGDPVTDVLISDGAPMAATAEPVDGSPRPIGAIATTVTTEGDIAGLAVSSCGPAMATQWLVGGAIATGRSSRIVLSNPGQTTATVDTTILTATGPAQPPAGQDVVVPAGQSRELLLQALTRAEGPTAIRVSSTGGRVAASLVDTALDGLLPKGVEVISASAARSRQVLAPLVSGPATLRLANPGEETLEVNWRVLGESGTVPSEEASGTAVPAGSVVEVPVTIPDDARALVVTADTPLLTALTMTRDRADGGADVAVAVPPAPLAPQNLVVPGPTGSSSALTLAAGSEPATVVLRQVDGTGTPVVPDQTLAIPADAARSVTLADGVSVAQVSVRAGTVNAGMLVTLGEFLAGTPVQPAEHAREQVPVLVQDRP